MSALEDDAIDTQTLTELDPGRARGRGSTRKMPTGWRQVALIGSITIVGPLCIDMYLSALPQINRDGTVRVYKDALRRSPQRRTVCTEIRGLLGRCIP